MALALPDKGKAYCHLRRKFSEMSRVNAKKFEIFFS
jgi:hypothetical protein